MKNTTPSATALFVANGMYFNSNRRRLRKDVSENYRSYYVQLIEHVYSIRSVFKRRFHLLKCSLSQRFTIDGFYLHFLLRKKCIEREVHSAIKNGYEQILILGAGYDLLGVSLSDKYPDVKFIEVDHPATSSVKQQLFKELNWAHPNRIELSFDLNESDVLFSSEHINKNSKTLIICEAVLMYLPPKTVDQILETIWKNFKRCKFVFTFMNEKEPGDYMFRDAHPMTSNYLRMNSEPFSWGMSVLGVEDFLEQRGWKLLDIFDDHRLRNDFLSAYNRNLPLAIGEHVVCCEPISNGK